MSFSELLKKTTLANVVAAAVIVASVCYAIASKDAELLKNICYVAVGYLFGVTAAKGVK